MEMELMTLAMLFGVALVAGFIDAIAGGGGLLTVPALLATGMPPALVLGTNKLQSSFGSFSATYYFARRGLLEWRLIWPAIVCTFIGAALGTLAVQTIDAAVLERVLPFLLVLFALYFMFSPRVSDAESQRRLAPLPFALVVGGGVGCYDGFFGPGTGSFFAIAFVALAGYGMARATAHTKLLNFTSNIASLLFFTLGGKVVWSVGLAMAVGQFIGARLGSRLVVSKGVKLIRPLLVTVSLVMCIKLLLNQYPELLALAH
ncbi:TSUP family transporter [Aeromonas simiae]|uniref:TSUP family transporter n=1 Tax=Aeromonas simiae TaxID=218936 RepID=UPI0005AB0F72|nr:TSUP family transporter [Aeromonas simiae]MDO2947698.1 TSUP family transporter [Aeromonas simiae]MDO2952318.1 TSUP family transporter [Aeromonas simiae]MDO2954913.1 TSUP family transporter [Aeromonas simiae]